MFCLGTEDCVCCLFFDFRILAAPRFEYCAHSNSELLIIDRLNLELIPQTLIET